MNVRLLLSTQRSGSHFLKSFIAAHFPTITYSGEILQEPAPLVHQYPALSSHPEVPDFWLWYAHEAAAGTISVMPGKRMEAFRAYLRMLTGLVAPRDLVLDIKYNSIRSLSGYWDTDHGSHDFTHFITSQKIPVLHLIRKNILRVLVSGKLASQTGIWHRTEERLAGYSSPKIRLDPKSILFEIRYALRLTQDYQNRFSGYPLYEEIIYEDFVREQRGSQGGPGMRTLGRFLGEPPAAPNQATLPFKKTTPEDPSEVVENWDEILRVLQRTEYGWMAQDPLMASA